MQSITTTQGNVLQLETLPHGWTDYDLIVSASMLEYIPRERLAEALAALRLRLADGGNLATWGHVIVAANTPPS